MPESMVGTLPKEKLELIAKEKLNEDPSRLDSDLDAIKQWIKKQPHLDGHIPIGEQSKMMMFFFKVLKLTKTIARLQFFFFFCKICPLLCKYLQ